MPLPSILGRTVLYIAAGALALNGAYHLARTYCGGEPGAPSPVPEYPLYDTMLVFGDSITHMGGNPSVSGYVLHLSNRFARRLDVLNRGFSGYNTRDALNVADRVFPKTTASSPISRWTKPDQAIFGSSKQATTLWTGFPGQPKSPRICLLFFGANDARLSPFPQHVPLAEFYNNTRQLVGLLRDPESEYYSPKTRILMITPPPTGDRMVEEICRRGGYPTDRKNAVTKEYAEAVATIAGEFGLPHVDLWAAIEGLVHSGDAFVPLEDPIILGSEKMDHVAREDTATHPGEADSTGSPYEGYERFLVDGLHLNSQGNEVLFKLIVEAIKEAWPDMD
ncbi:isoamyl acetate-hydrolyzing esterase [Coemansia sp. RSA 552]|nr:isoamyl acetate-hydrolyzing esterase [Coemansia sp. RSA 552]